MTSAEIYSFGKLVNFVSTSAYQPTRELSSSRWRAQARHQTARRTDRQARPDRACVKRKAFILISTDRFFSETGNIRSSCWKGATVSSRQQIRKLSDRLFTLTAEDTLLSLPFQASPLLLQLQPPWPSRRRRRRRHGCSVVVVPVIIVDVQL